MCFLQARPCIFQPGTFTGWGSEGVKRDDENSPTKERIRSSWTRVTHFYLFFYFYFLHFYFLFFYEVDLVRCVLLQLVGERYALKAVRSLS